MHDYPQQWFAESILLELSLARQTLYLTSQQTALYWHQNILEHITFRTRVYITDLKEGYRIYTIPVALN